jgi:hypothetical protein
MLIYDNKTSISGNSIYFKLKKDLLHTKGQYVFPAIEFHSYGKSINRKSRLKSPSIRVFVF